VRELATSLGITLKPGLEAEREIDVDEYLLTDRDGTAHRGRVTVELTFKVKRRPSAEMQHGYLALVLAQLDAEPWRGGTCQRSTTRRGTFGGAGSCTKKVSRAVVRRGVLAEVQTLTDGEFAQRLSRPGFDFCCSAHADASAGGSDVLAVVTIPARALEAATQKDTEQKALAYAERREREKVCADTWEHPKDCRCRVSPNGGAP
jgi:hypothetical protein